MIIFWSNAWGWPNNGFSSVTTTCGEEKIGILNRSFCWKRTKFEIPAWLTFHTVVSLRVIAKVEQSLQHEFFIFSLLSTLTSAGALMFMDHLKYITKAQLSLFWRRPPIWTSLSRLCIWPITRCSWIPCINSQEVCFCLSYCNKLCSGNHTGDLIRRWRRYPC